MKKPKTGRDSIIDSLGQPSLKISLMPRLLNCLSEYIFFVKLV